MRHNPLKAYEDAGKQMLSGRDLESVTLTKAANQLRACRENWDSAISTNMLNDSLKMNQKIWTIFQAEIEKPDNPLPPEIKNNLLRLVKFIDKRTFEIMSFPSPEKLGILIEINANIAAGLSRKD